MCPLVLRTSSTSSTTPVLGCGCCSTGVRLPGCARAAALPVRGAAPTTSWWAAAVLLQGPRAARGGRRPGGAQARRARAGSGARTC